MSPPNDPKLAGNHLDVDAIDFFKRPMFAQQKADA